MKREAEQSVREQPGPIDAGNPENRFRGSCNEIQAFFFEI